MIVALPRSFLDRRQVAGVLGIAPYYSNRSGRSEMADAFAQVVVDASKHSGKPLSKPRPPTKKYKYICEPPKLRGLVLKLIDGVKLTPQEIAIKSEQEQERKLQEVRKAQWAEQDKKEALLRKQANDAELRLLQQRQAREADLLQKKQIDEQNLFEIARRKRIIDESHTNILGKLKNKLSAAGTRLERREVGLRKKFAEDRKQADAKRDEVVQKQKRLQKQEDRKNRCRLADHKKADDRLAERNEQLQAQINQKKKTQAKHVGKIRKAYNKKLNEQDAYVQSLREQRRQKNAESQKRQNDEMMERCEKISVVKSKREEKAQNKLNQLTETEKKRRMDLENQSISAVEAALVRKEKQVQERGVGCAGVSPLHADLYDVAGVHVVGDWTVGAIIACKHGQTQYISHLFSGKLYPGRLKTKVHKSEGTLFYGKAHLDDSILAEVGDTIAHLIARNKDWRLRFEIFHILADCGLKCKESELPMEEALGRGNTLPEQLERSPLPFSQRGKHNPRLFQPAKPGSWEAQKQWAQIHARPFRPVELVAAQQRVDDWRANYNAQISRRRAAAPLKLRKKYYNSNGSKRIRPLIKASANQE